MDQNRDSGFIWVIRQAYKIFGPNGYVSFREYLFVVFASFAAWLALEIPDQPRIRAFSVLLSVCTVCSIFTLKAFVQIREGLAFLFLMVAVVEIFKRSRPGIVLFTTCVGLATLFHLGMAVFALALLLAVGLGLAPQYTLSSIRFKRALLFGSLLLGSGLGWLILNSAHVLRYVLADYGVNASASARGFLAKYVYWGINGLVILILRRQMEVKPSDSTKFSYALGLSIGSFLIPFLYALCSTLVFFNFQTPALTAMVIRLLFTSIELAILIIACRRNGNLLTVGIAVFLLADRLRLALIQGGSISDQSILA